jgi:hypothetical protein
MRWALLLVLFLCACSKGAEADLPSIAAARSLGAEWALVNEQAARGRLTTAYIETMRRSFREQLKATASSLTQRDSPYGHEIDALLALPGGASPDQLRAHVGKLRHIERSLESA